MNKKKGSIYEKKGQKRGRGRPPKIVDKKDDVSANKTFKTRKVNFDLKIPKSVRRGKMDIDTEQMLKDLEELGRIKPSEKLVGSKSKLKNQLMDLPKSPLKKMIEKSNGSILKITVVFFSIIILFMFSVLYLLNSKTVINIQLKKISENINTNKTFQLFNDKDNLDDQDVVAMYSNITATESAQYQVGYKDIVDGTVEGRLKIINNSQEKKVFVKTTRFVSDITGDLYRLKEDTVIPANDTVEVVVYADNKIVKGEETGTTFRIPGLRTEEAQRLIYGESLERFSFGTVKKQIVDESDLLKASDFADVKLKQKAIDELRKKIEVGANYELLADSLNYVITNKKFDAKVGDEKNVINVTGSVEATAVFIDKDKVLTLIKNEVLSKNPNGYSVNISADNLTMEILRADYLTRDLMLNIKVLAHSDYDVSKIINKNDIAGMAVSSFYKYMSDRGIAQRVTVVNYPFWNKKITSIEDNIIIRLK